MNTDFVILPAAKSGNSVKLKGKKVKERHIETIELEKQNQEMEQKLNQLRQSMSREKEERERSNGYYWKSGQVGHFGSQNKENIGKISSGRIKLKVLKDQIEKTEKKKVVATSTKIPSAERTKIKGKTCGQCEMKTALLMCVECGEDYCPSCFAKIPQKGALKLHRTMPVKWKSLTDKLDASYQPKKEQNFDESREKLGADKEISSNMVSTATFSSIQKQKINEADFFVPTKPVVNNGQSLLHGTFDEEESSKSFKDAVLEWRNGYHGYQSKQSESETDCTGNSETQTVLTGATNSFEVEFKDNGLKYMERLMLKKHRRTPIDYVTKTDNYRSSRTSVPEFNDTQALTADEMEDHEYFVELFKPKEDVRTEVIHEPALKIMELVEPPEDHLEESRSFFGIRSDTSPVRTTAKRKNIPQHSTFSVTRENAALAEDVTAINVEKEEDQLLTTSRLMDSKSMKYNGSNDNHSLDTAGVVNLSKELQSIALRGESAAVQYYGLKGFFVLDVDPKETIHDRTPLQTIKQTATDEIFCRDGNRWRPESNLSECADKSVVDNIVTNIQIQYPKHLVEHMSSPMQANQRMQKPLTVSQSPRSYSSKTRSQKRSELCQISHTRNVITRPVSRAASEISEIESIDLTEQDDPLFEDHEERKTLSILEKELHALRDDLDKNKKQPQELVSSVRSSKTFTEFSQKKQVKEHTNTDWLPKRAMESLQSCDVETESDDDKESLHDKLNVLSLQ
ncbi:zinc finger B-box domain-containing protein 1-like [Bombina bombina]|uniref:zinc finger B-box domain-containing protein 1-like n=1 Tax=Bombina bombina TaxID=8345 RepID=UPI00235AD38F|nr:zinc finger B-box domain-containing protein 1-like [Bombina bombina]